MGTGPMVTVAVPTYGNRAHLLGEALRSVLDQTVHEIEVFVSNDRSTDETPSVVAAFDDPRVHYSELPPPGGLHANLNRCLEFGSSPFLAICQDDDIWMPDNLERLVAVMEKDPGVALAHGAFTWIDLAGRTLREWSAWDGWKHSTTESGHDFIQRSMSSINRINMSSALIRRSSLRDTRFRDQDGPLCDTGMWLRLARQGDIAFVGEPLTALRIHAGAASVQEGINDKESRGATFEEVLLSQRAKEQFLAESGYEPGEMKEHLLMARRWARNELLRIVTRRTSPRRGPLSTMRLLREAAEIEPSLIRSPRTWRVVLASMAGRRGRQLAHRLVGSPRPINTN